jgi:hypothetical protein
MATRKKSPTRRTPSEIKAELAEVARIGQAFIDGDLLRRALQPYAETFMTGDDLDMNPETCVPLKKTLFRLERLSRVPCSTTLWRRRPDMPACAEAVLFGSWRSPMSPEAKPPNRGYRPEEMSPQLAAPLIKGKSSWRITRHVDGVLVDRGLAQPMKESESSITVELFVPVKDSMGEIAGALEIFTAGTVD